MLAVNYSTIRNNLKTFLDVVTNDFETLIITRKNNDNVVVISETEYNNMQENLFIRQNKQNYDELMQSVHQLNNGNATIKELADNE